MPDELKVDSDETIKYLTNRLRIYLQEYSGNQSAVIGLSGGVDSSVVACLAIRAVGVDKVHLYYLPSESTSSEDEEDVQAMIRMMRIPPRNFRTIPIDSLVKRFSREIRDCANDRLIMGNVKARARMVLLHAFAQQHKALVVGTGDKSELTIGYFTKFGDGGVDVLPIGDLFKSQVRQLAATLDLPPRIYQKPPSPGLWKDQSAEGELGIDYFLLDRILYHRFELWEDAAKISEELKIPLKVVNRIVAMVKRTQHKRYPPEIFRVSFRSHGSDWRYPREWH